MAEEKSKLQQWYESGEAPAATPSGYTQTQEAAAGLASGDPAFENTALGRMAAASAGDAARGWYTGANQDGMESGWSTDFMETAMGQWQEQQDDVAKSGDGRDFFNWFDREDATGVVLWDDEKRDLKRGDVYVDGAWQSNLYDDMGKKEADWMVLEFTRGGKVKSELFSSDDRDALVAKEVTSVMDAWSADVAAAELKSGFDDDVTERQDKLREGHGDTALVAGAAGAGALLLGLGGAAIGTFFAPGLGTAVGWGAGLALAGTGAAVGGGSAAMNIDQLTHMTARGQEVVERANTKYGPSEASSMALKEYSGVGLKLISPLSNLTQGTADWKHGDIGDGTSEFYNRDSEGNPTVSGWWKAADMAATLGDSLLQSSSGAGIAMFMTGTGAHVAGSTTFMAQTGAGWSDYKTDFDSYDGKEWLPAVGGVAIDAVQFGGAGMIARAGIASRTALGGAEAAAAQAAPKTAFGRTMNRWAGKDPDTQFLSGMKFAMAKDADGIMRATSATPSLSLLAPSEFTKWIPAAARARNRAALTGGAAGPDDYYRAAVDLAQGKRGSYAMINAWGEGTEEAIQGIAEPKSFSQDVDGRAVIEQFFYGAAAGAGMSFGAMSNPGDGGAMRRQANIVSILRHGTPITDAQWKDMSPSDRNDLQLLNETEARLVGQVQDSVQQNMAIDTTRSSAIGAMAMMDFQTTLVNRDMASANPKVDGSLQLAPFSGDTVVAPDGQIDKAKYAANAVVMSLPTLMRELENNHKGQVASNVELKRRIEKGREIIKETTDPDTVAQLTTELQELEADDQFEAVLDQARRYIGGELRSLYAKYNKTTDRAKVERTIDQINKLIKQAWEGSLPTKGGTPRTEAATEALRRSVETIYSRHPYIDSGSFVALMPQVSLALTEANAHSLGQVHQSILLAPNADHDGDAGAAMNAVSLAHPQRQALRAGQHYLQRGADGVYKAVTEAPGSEPAFLAILAEGAQQTDTHVHRQLFDQARIKLNSAILSRYSPIVDKKTLDKFLKEFWLDVKGESPLARMTLLEKIINHDPAGFVRLSRQRSTPEVLWFMQRVSVAWDTFQMGYAANAPRFEYTPAEVDAPLPPDRAHQLRRAVEDAVSSGQSMSLLLGGNDPVRKGQKLHYSLFRAAVSMTEGDLVSPEAQDLIELYTELGADVVLSETDRIRSHDAVQRRAAAWIQKLVEQRKDLGVSEEDTLLAIANTKVRDMRMVGPGVAEFVDGEVSFLQLLLKRSLDIEEMRNEEILDRDEDLQRKLRRLRRLTERSAEDQGHSTTAQQAVREVFGSFSLYNLIGDSSKYLGPQRTMNQLIAEMTDMSEDSRKKLFYHRKRKAPYVMHGKLGNPPYTAQEVTSADFSAYKFLVDATYAISSIDQRDKTRSELPAREAFKKGIKSWQAAVDAYAELHSEQMTGMSRKDIQRAMLEQNDRQTKAIAALLPDASKVGAISIIDGQVYASAWVEDMLLQDPEQAELTYFLYSKFAEWAQMGGNINLEDADFGKTLDPNTGKKEYRHPYEYGRIKSRFLQTIYALATHSDGFELDRLLNTAMQATNLDSLFEIINADPVWRGDRAALLPFHDDVALFERDTSNVWANNLAGTTQREAMMAFGSTAKMFSAGLVAQQAEFDGDLTLVSAIRDAQKGVDRDGGMDYLRKVRLTILNGKLRPEGVGPQIRDRVAAAVQDGIIRIHDKGTADKRIAPLGNSLITADEFGVKHSSLQTSDAMDAYGVREIMSNPTLLLDGPVRVMDNNGGTIMLDMSTEDGVINAIADPRTNAFAKMVAFDITKELNIHGIAQSYQNVPGTSLKAMLDAATLEHLFAPLGDQLTPEQVYGYMDKVESAMRKATVNEAPDVREAATFALQRMHHEFLVAYSHMADANIAVSEKLRYETLHDIVQAHQYITALDLLDASDNHAVVNNVLDTLRASLKLRYQKDSTETRKLFESKAEAAFEQLLKADLFLASLKDSTQKLTTMLGETTNTAEERAKISSQLTRLRESAQSRVEKLNLMRDNDMVNSVIAMFTMTGNDAADFTRKEAILDFLGKGGRINKLDGAKGGYLLHNKVRSLLSDPSRDLTSDDIKLSEWDALGTDAAVIYLNELSGPSAGNIGITKLILGPEGEKRRRLFDSSWSYLLDGFRNPTMLKASTDMARQAHWGQDVNKTKVINLLESRLFDGKKLGKHTELIVSETVKAEYVLKAASVGLAIPVAGDLPKDMAAYVGAGRRTYKVPGADMLTVEEFDAHAGNAVSTIEMFTRLHNHFVGELTLVTPTGEIDLLPTAGHAWMGHEDVENSPYRFVTSESINKAVDEARESLKDTTSTLTLRAAYFNVENKPFEKVWANNVFFEGIGRATEVSVSTSLVGEMYFGVGALSKEGQQNPLNVATKGGNAYVSTPVTSLEVGLQAEQESTVAKTLYLKVLHKLHKPHDFGMLHPGDHTTLFAYEKFRHLVIGKNAAGQTERWWSDKAIKWQFDNNGAEITSDEFPLRDAKLVPLSDEVARTLLGEPGGKGVPGVMVAQRLNPDELELLPSLDSDRIRSLGLSKLGEEISLETSSFSGLAALPSMPASTKGDRSGLARHEKAIEMFREQQVQVRNARGVYSRTGTTNFDITRINQQNEKALRNVIGDDIIARTLQHLQIPWVAEKDLQEISYTKRMADKLIELQAANPSRVIWQHRQGYAADPTAGVLSEVHTKAGFENMESKHSWPTYEDIIVLDLDSFIANTRGDLNLAYDQAKAVVRQYTKRGVTIALAKGKEGGTLRNDIAALLNAGSMGYERMSESPHLFAPATSSTARSKSRRALDSTLTAVHQFKGDSIVVSLFSDFFGTSSAENGMFYDLRPEQPIARAESFTIIPSEPGFDWGHPQKGTGELDQVAQVREKLLAFFKDPGAIKLLKKMGGDPHGVQVYSKDEATGREVQGILDLESAVAQLMSTLEAGKLPTDRGQTIMLGTIVPLVNNDDSILLTRVGFQLGDTLNIKEQLSSRTVAGIAGSGDIGAGIAIARDKLQTEWTVKPPGIVEESQVVTNYGTGIRVKYDLSRFSKHFDEGQGWKAVYSPLPNHIAPPIQALGRNGLRINSFGSLKDPEGKQATSMMVNNYRAAFALSGIDFRADMVEYLFGKKDRDAAKLSADWLKAKTILDAISNIDTTFEEQDIFEMLNSPDPLLAVSNLINSQVSDVIGLPFALPGSGRAALEPRNMTANARLGEVFIASLLAPGVEVDHLVSSSGLISLEDLTSGADITLLAPIFTDALDNLDFPQLREMLHDRVNAHFPKDPGSGRPYTIGLDWATRVQMSNPLARGKIALKGTNNQYDPEIFYVDGYLNIALQYPAAENTVSLDLAVARAERQDASQHVADVLAGTIGARVNTERAREAQQIMFAAEGVKRFGVGEGSGGFWKMLNSIPKQDKTFKPWKTLTHMQRSYARDAAAKMVSYQAPIDKYDEAWNEGDRIAVKSLENSILSILFGSNLEKYRPEMDYLVRQFFGVPGVRKNQPEWVDRVSPGTARQALELILENVSNGRNPMWGSVVPTPDATFMKLVREAGLSRSPSARWAPVMDKKGQRASTWTEWVDTIFGQAMESEVNVDSMYRQDLDGFMHTYQGETDLLNDMPLSFDRLTNVKLMDVDTEEFYQSLDKNQEALISDPILLETMNISLAALTGQEAKKRLEYARENHSSELSQRIAMHVAWHRKQDIPKQKRTRLRDYQHEGVWYQQSNRDTHQFMHNAVNLSIGMRLANPALWTSAMLELTVRAWMDDAANIMTGQSTSVVGKQISRFAPSLTRYSMEDYKTIDKLADEMGRDERFLAMIYDEMTYKQLVESGRGRVGERLEKFAGFSARLTSDPSFGMLAKQEAKRYLNAAIEHMDAMPNKVSMTTLAAEMNRNPEWLKDQYSSGTFNPHKAGLNRVAEVKGMRATVLSNAMMGSIGAMTASPRRSVNFAGHAVKIPFLFTRFNANAMTSLMGLGGLDQMTAMFLSNRQHERGALGNLNTTVGKAVAAMRGEAYIDQGQGNLNTTVGKAAAAMRGEAYIDQGQDNMGMENVLEGVDLTRPFVKGAMTHVGLMFAGLAAQGLNFSGEDEETKRRRRIAAYTNTPYYFDPRRVENDFLHADAVFMDWMPDWMSMPFRAAPGVDGGTRAYAKPHWIVRQFLSPIVGMERFLNDGDARHIKWGFLDAYSAIPTAVVRLFTDADVTADALIETAKDEDALGDEANTANVSQLILSAVGMYERALFESSFANGLRNANDEFDRNPYARPDTLDGVVVRDGDGDPVATDELEAFRDPETGEVRRGYANREGSDARKHQYAENNLTAALALSVFSGQWGTDSSFLRKNMVVKTPKFELDEFTRAEAEAAVLMAFRGQTNLGNIDQPEISVDEMSAQLLEDAVATGTFMSPEERLAKAKEIIAARGEGHGALSLLDKEGQEILTKDGARGVLRGLEKGSVKFGDDVLAGVYITEEMRTEIQEEWTDELIVEGLQLGLHESVARARAKRIWYGRTFEDPNAIGLQHILWSTDIPRKGSVEYKQLNLTYAMGPDGKPWATPFSRDKMAGVFGIPTPIKSVFSTENGLGVDNRGKVTDAIYGINTGLHGLKRVEEEASFFEPPEVDFDKKVDYDAKDKPKNGWVNYPKRKYGGGGGGGGGGGYFSRMYALPRANVPYGNSIPNINTSNPMIRRAFIRRERVWSERGRLKQWQ